MNFVENHQCRTCYNATERLIHLTNQTKCGDGEQEISYAELLEIVCNINIMEDINKELPQFICACCAHDLKAAQKFIRQSEEVTERLTAMLSSQANQNMQINSLQEPPVVIKMEYDGPVVEESFEVPWHADLRQEEPIGFKINQLNDETIVKKDGDNDDATREFFNKNNMEMEILKCKVDTIISQQKRMTKMIAENTVLLHRNLGLFEVTQTLFPIDSEEKLGILENNLATENKDDITGTITRIICGNLRNIDKILTKDLIVLYNFDGTKDKKSLKSYANVLNALYESTKKEGYTYEDFKKELRAIFRRIKNTHNKDRARKEQKENAS